MPNPLATGDAHGRAPGEPAVSTEGIARPVRFPCFDGLRAIAALAVFACHSSGWLWYVREGWAPVVVQSSFARLGLFGVAVFFVISGFLLYRPFVLAHLEGRPPPTVGRFWFRRCARVFPAYWVALIGAWLLFGIMAMPRPIDVVTYFGLLQNYRGGYVYSGLGVAWTLVIEVSFYFVLPGIAWLVRSLTARDASRAVKVRAQLIALTVIGVVSLAFQVWSVYLDRSAEPSVDGWFPLDQAGSWLLAYLAWFVVGMLLATGSAWRETGGRLPRAVEHLARRPWLAWTLSAVILIAITRIKYPWIPRFILNENERVTAGQEFLRFTLSLAAAALLVFPAVFGDQEEGGIRRLLRSRVMVALGLISYGIYLWHDPLWKISFDWVRRGLIPSGPVAQFAVVFGLTIFAATASYFIVERPIRGWAQRRTRVRSAR